MHLPPLLALNVVFICIFVYLLSVCLPWKVSVLLILLIVNWIFMLWGFRVFFLNILDINPQLDG